VPKVYAFFLVVFRRESRLFGGVPRLLGSIALEIAVSTLLAPVRMLNHSRFVLLTLLGRETQWARQQREMHETRWGEAFRHHFPGTLAALLWAAALFFLNRNLFFWISPILFSLVFSIPISVLTSRRSLGLWLRRRKILLTPEESDPPTELARLEMLHRQNSSQPQPLGLPVKQGFRRAVADPSALRLRIAQVRGPRRLPQSIARRRQILAEHALRNGPDSLSREEKRELLRDAAVLTDLHREVWKLPEEVLRERWGVVLP